MHVQAERDPSQTYADLAYSGSQVGKSRSPLEMGFDTAMCWPGNGLSVPRGAEFSDLLRLSRASSGSRRVGAGVPSKAVQ